LNIEGLQIKSRMVNGYEEGCTWGARIKKGRFSFEKRPFLLKGQVGFAGVSNG
jgi:hypothetical protein